MRIAMLTKEYPPEIYGGAGVHVTELTRHLRELEQVDVHCMGAPREEANVYVHGVDPELKEANASVRTLSTGLRMANALGEADVVHSHTWYTGLGGHVGGKLWGIPHIATAHSLEPHRPWKREQLGGGYEVSSWSEKNAMENADAVIAVSQKMKGAILEAYPNIEPDKIHVVLNGIDSELWQPRPAFAEALEASGRSILDELGVDPSRPLISFVGRITRQKGVPHLLKAIRMMDPEIQVVLCAGAPDTPEIEAEVTELVQILQSERDGVHWVKNMLDKNLLQENADAVIAVSQKMKGAILEAYPNIEPDKIHVVLNGIDSELWQPRPAFAEALEASGRSILDELGVDPSRPLISFVGRITRQKGVPHLLKAIRMMDPEIQVVLCAGAPDTPEIEAEVTELVQILQSERDGVHWVKNMLDKNLLQEILTASDAFLCPSVYEPLGIVNLEAMACNTTVVASDVGGIPEVVQDGVTGTLVHYEESDPEAFEIGLAKATNDLLADPAKVEAYGAAGRERAVSTFSWATIAEETIQVYRSLL